MRVQRYIDKLFRIERDEMIRYNAAVESDRLLLMGIMMVATTAYTWLLNDFFYFAWCSIFWIVSAFGIVMARRFARLATVGRYCINILVETVQSALTLSLLFRLWISDMPAIKLSAFVFLVGVVLFVLSDRAKIKSLAFLDAVVIQAALNTGWISILLGPTVTGPDIALSIGIATLQVYHLVSIRGILKSLTSIEEAKNRSLQAQKMEAIGRLSGGIAHDFNNILTVILGNLDLHDEISDDDEKAELLEGARTAALRAVTLTGQLLAFSRQVPMKVTKVELGSLAEEVQKIVDRVLPAGVDFQIEKSPFELCAWADSGYLSNALLNLVINARDAIEDQGQITLTIRKIGQREVEDLGLAGGDYALLSVRDSGPGFTENAMEHAFDPFFTTKPVGKGSGLGLSMVKGFAEQSEGAARIINVSGGGARVELALPAAL